METVRASSLWPPHRDTAQRPGGGGMTGSHSVLRPPQGDTGACAETSLESVHFGFDALKSKAHTF